MYVSSLLCLPSSFSCFVAQSTISRGASPNEHGFLPLNRIFFFYLATVAAGAQALHFCLGLRDNFDSNRCSINKDGLILIGVSPSPMHGRWGSRCFWDLLWKRIRLNEVCTRANWFLFLMLLLDLRTIFFTFIVWLSGWIIILIHVPSAGICLCPTH